MDNEEFIIKLGADTTDFDAKFEEAKKKIDNMANNVVIDFDASSANESLTEATAAMEKFKASGRGSGKITTEIDDAVKLAKDNVVGLIKESKVLGPAFEKAGKAINEALDFEVVGNSLRKTTDNIKSTFENDSNIKSDKQRGIGIRPLKAVPLGLNKDWRLTERFGIPLANAVGMPKLAEKLQNKVNPEKQDLSPSEALGRFRGMTKAMTYSSVLEDMFGSLADNRARATILNKIYIEAKEGLAKYDSEMKIAKANIKALEEAEAELKATQDNLWKNNPGANEYDNYEDYKAHLEERKAELVDGNKFELADRGEGAIDDQIAKISSEMEQLNQQRKDGLADKSLKKDSDEYTAIIEKIKNYKKELFELQSLKANNGQFYEKAADLPDDLRVKATPSGEIVERNDDYKTELENINNILSTTDSQYTEIDKKIIQAREDAEAFKQVLEESARNERLLINDLQKNPDKEGYSSKELQGFNKPWKVMRAQFDKFNPAKKMMNAFTRLGARVKQQMTSIVANVIDPIYVVQRSVNAFLSNNVRYANTFKVVTYNMYRVIEPLIKNLITWSLKALQYANIFIKTWSGVDLFDKAAYDTNKMKNDLKDITASFDELHPIGEDDTTLMDTGELPEIDFNMAKKLQGWADKLKPIAQKIGNMFAEAFKHPLATLLKVWLAAEALKLIKTLFGETILTWGKVGFGKLLAWVGKGFKALFTGESLFSTWASGGKITALQVMSTLLGGILTIVSSIYGVWNSIRLTRDWSELSKGEKAFGLLGEAASLATTFMGVFMMTKNPLIAAAATFVLGITEITAAFFTTRTAIGSVKEELEEYENALEEAKDAEERYRNSLANLKFLEEEYGQTGKEVFDIVADGKVKYEDLTYAQMQLYNAYVETSDLQEQKVAKSQQAVVEGLEAEIAKVKENEETYEECFAKIEEAYKNGEIGFEDYVDVSERLYADLDKKSRETFVENIPSDLAEAWNPKHYVSAGDSMKQWWSGIVRFFKDHKAEGIFTMAIAAVGGASLGGKLGAMFGSIFGPIGTVVGGLLGLFGGALVTAFLGNSANQNTSEKTVNQLQPSLTGQQSSMTGYEYDPNKIKNKYALGTNYVPNDQIALVHKGEAIIPAEYNKAAQGNAYKPGVESDMSLEAAVNTLTSATNQLISAVNQGINVRGEFKQRGNDLYATVEKVRNQRGSSTILNNPAFAR